MKLRIPPLSPADRMAMLAGVLVVLLFWVTGCASTPLTGDQYPAGLDARCHLAQARACEWFQHRYPSRPLVVKPWIVELTDKPLNGMAAWTTDCRGGYRTVAAREYFESSIDHEARHTMGCQSEDSVR